MPIYISKCNGCGRIDDRLAHEFIQDGAEFDSCPCDECGSDEFTRAGINLTADMSNQWETRCRFQHGVKRHVDKPDPAVRQAQNEKRHGQAPKP